MIDDTEVEEFENVTCEKETPRAVLVRGPWKEAKWIPKSVIDDNSEVYGDTGDAAGPGTLIVKRWFAEKAELS